MFEPETLKSPSNPLKQGSGAYG